jgi:hypothetical protein
MATPMDRRAVEAAVTKLQEALENGDPSDLELRALCESGLTSLRAAYRADPKSFTPELVDALKELVELLRDTAPDPKP